MPIFEEMRVIHLINFHHSASRADGKDPSFHCVNGSDMGDDDAESIACECEHVLDTVLDEQEMPESCVDCRGDSTGIIKPDAKE